MLTLETAREWLRLDNTDNDPIIEGLLTASVEYIELTTGVVEAEQVVSPLCETAQKFLLSLWYDPTQVDTERMQRSVDSLLKTISIKKI